ncbi:LysR family transcriptional regulator [Sphingomonas morindae]|uniref:LysR family transcriptional regulator n=1 Tax=Sphingomonas morindae TaxID=1541170 RepID=UPI002078FD85|nr:LysR family transcriptional regulator [Sphingomonas morindae]
MAAFAAVAAERSFVRAARRLDLSPTALSRRIAALEDRLGTRLFNRTTRSVSLTETGAAMLADVTPAMAGLDAACARAAGHERRPRGRVRINLPRIAAIKLVQPVLPIFASRYPEVEIDLVIDDHVRDIVGDGFDAGVRLGGLVQKDMTAVRLTPEFRMMAVCSPAYLRDRLAPRRPADLLDHRCLTYRFSETGLLQKWAFDDGAGPVVIDPGHALTSNDTRLLLDCALAGMGIAYLGEPLVAEFVSSGLLIQLLRDWTPPVGAFYLYHPGRRLMPPALRAFIDVLVTEGQTRMRRA